MGRTLLVPFLNLARQVASVRAEVEQAIAATLDSGRFVGGEPVASFERELAAYCGAEHAVGVASGTDAIGIALRAVGVGPGDEVVTAANTCVATIAGIEAAGATPVLVDPDPVSFTLDPAALESVLTERTRAVVPVHLYGQCADIDAISAIAAKYCLKVVEDAAQAHGAELGGRRAGTLGDAAAFSFYPTKNLGALGDGGAVVTNDSAVADRARLLRTYGERDRYDSILAGTNSRLDTLQAAVLLKKLAHLDRWNERRRELAARYLDGLAETDFGLPHEAPGRRHVFHLFVITFPDRDRLRERLAEAGVGTLVHYPRAVHQQSAYAHLSRPPDGLPVAERLASEVLSLPLYPELSAREVDSVVAAARGAARR